VLTSANELTHEEAAVVLVNGRDDEVWLDTLLERQLPSEPSDGWWRPVPRCSPREVAGW